MWIHRLQEDVSEEDLKKDGIKERWNLLGENMVRKLGLIAKLHEEK